MILELNLSNMANDDLIMFKNIVGSTLQSLNTRLKSDIALYWYYVSDENETKQQMQIWCHAIYELYIQFATALLCGLNQLDLSKLPPSAIAELKKIIVSQLNYIYNDIQIEMIDFKRFNFYEKNSIEYKTTLHDFETRLLYIKDIKKEIYNQFNYNGY